MSTKKSSVTTPLVVADNKDTKITNWDKWGLQITFINTDYQDLGLPKARAHVDVTPEDVKLYLRTYHKEYQWADNQYFIKSEMSGLMSVLIEKIPIEGEWSNDF